MKRYILTHDQVLELQLSGIRYGRDSSREHFQALGQLQEECFKRPVPDWATHFTSGFCEGTRCEEIE